MLERIYEWLHRRVSKPAERGEYSAGYWQNKVRESALAIAKGYRGRLLEVGCGEGLFLERLIRDNPDLEVWGVDPWPEMLQKARKRLGGKKVRLEKASLTKLPFVDSSFDAVVCVNVFININTQEEIFSGLKEMARVCKPGGRLIIEFRNKFNFLIWLKFKLAKHYDATIRDRNLALMALAEDDVKEKLSGFGMNILQTYYLESFIKKLAPIVILEAVKP